MIDGGLRLFVIFALGIVILTCALGLMVLYEILGTLRKMSGIEVEKGKWTESNKQFVMHWALVIVSAVLLCVVAIFFQ